MLALGDNDSQIISSIFGENWISDNIMEGVKLQIDARNSATSVNFHFQAWSPFSLRLVIYYTAR